jgi:hypothetical protein
MTQKHTAGRSCCAPEEDHSHRRGELRDGGTRKVYNTGAQKEDSSKTEGKGRYDLLPPTAIRRIAEIYRKGAIKYTKDLPITFDNGIGKMISLCICQNENHIVIHILGTMLKGCAETATSVTLKRGIQTLLNDREKTVALGQQIIGNARDVLTRSTSEGLILKKESHCEPGLTLLNHWESHLQKLNPSWKSKEEFAQSARLSQKDAGSTQTTIIPQTSYEDSCVLNVTKESDFLEMTSKVLEKHSSTCRIHQHIFFQNNQIYEHHEGDRNWEQGIPLSRYLDSAKRHLDQYQEGMLDEDHLAQAAWNLLGLLHTEEMIRRGILPRDLSDLPSYMPVDADPEMWRHPPTKDDTNGKDED